MVVSHTTGKYYTQHCGTPEGGGGSKLPPTTKRRV